MKNNLDAGSYKTRRLNFCICNKLTATWAFAGVLSLTLLLFSLAGLLVVLNSSRALAAPSASYTKSATLGNSSQVDTSTPTTTNKPSPTGTITSTTTSTPTPTTTSTPSPTSTTTSTPTPTTTSTPSPTSTPTSTSSPTPKASPTSTASPASTTSPTSTATSTATASATHGATATVTAAATQDSSSSQTPPTSSTDGAQNTSQDQQSSGFPVLALAIGLAACITTISVLLVGWHFLRKHLLPVSSSKLPSSGAGPWSRVRTGTTPVNTYANNSLQHDGANSWVPTNPSSWGHDAVTSTWNPAPGSGWSAPTPNTGTFAQPNGAFSPTTGGLAPTNDSYFPANSGFAPTTNPSNASTGSTAFVAPANNYGSPGQFPSTSPGSYAWTTDPPAKPMPGKPVRLQALSPSDSQPGAYDQQNSSQVSSDFNDPYLQEMIRQYSQKSQAVGEQKNEDR